MEDGRKALLIFKGQNLLKKHPNKRETPYNYPLPARKPSRFRTHYFTLVEMRAFFVMWGETEWLLQAMRAASGPALLSVNSQLTIRSALVVRTAGQPELPSPAVVAAD